MVNFPGRNDRRRRVLKEEVLSTSNAHAALRCQADSGAANRAPRYSDAADVENHPQVTDFVPRRYSTIALLVLVGVASTASTAAIHYFVLPIATSLGMRSTAFDLAARGNLQSWLAAVVLLCASSFCVMTYSIRRHRIDDFRGRYRVWLGAALACLILSANSVAGLHQVLADVLTRLTGWTALRDGAVWWLLAAGLPMGWIFVRVLLDTSECRVGEVLFVGAIIGYAVSAVSFLGYGPMIGPRGAALLTATPLLLGHWLVFSAVVAYARFVVLDAQGLATARRSVKVKRTQNAPPAKQSSKQIARSAPATEPTLSAVELARSIAQSAKRPADTNQWVDGRRPERVRYDDDEDDDDSADGDRKLSKSERKRLRKLKAQTRAA